MTVRTLALEPARGKLVKMFFLFETRQPPAPGMAFRLPFFPHISYNVRPSLLPCCFPPLPPVIY